MNYVHNAKIDSSRPAQWDDAKLRPGLFVLFVPSVQLFSLFASLPKSKTSCKYRSQTSDRLTSNHLNPSNTVRPTVVRYASDPVRHPSANASDASAPCEVELVAPRQVGAP